MPRSQLEVSESKSLGPPPTHVYKYRSMDALGLERVFTRSEVWFASPAGFNDPYDCKVGCIVYDRKASEYRRYAEKVMARHAPAMPAEERAERARLGAVDPDRGKTIGKQLQKSVDGLGIFSVSTTPSHPLLWSHYAFGHTGLCLEFRCEGLFKEDTISGDLFPVCYSYTFPLISEAADHYEQAKAVLLTKSSHWEYEAEARYLDWQRGPGYREFRPENLTAVIFGCRMTPEDRERVRNWVACGATSPRLCEALIREGEYALDLRSSD